MAKLNSSLDYESLDNVFNKKTYKLADVKDQIVKVSWDVVRFPNSDNASKLWKVESGADGQEYLVALYNQEEEQLSKEAWEVTVTKTASHVQFSYKGEPIVKVASATLGIPPAELGSLSEYLPKKLASNKKLVASLLGTLNSSAKKELFSKYPELA
jgi:hypothetical protein